MQGNINCIHEMVVVYIQVPVVVMNVAAGCIHRYCSPDIIFQILYMLQMIMDLPDHYVILRCYCIEYIGQFFNIIIISIIPYGIDFVLSFSTTCIMIIININFTMSCVSLTFIFNSDPDKHYDEYNNADNYNNPDCQ